MARGFVFVKRKENALKRLEEILGYTFTDKSLLENALTHSSYANENRSGRAVSNERLEFLGDSVLGMITAEYLYRTVEACAALGIREEAVRQRLYRTRERIRAMLERGEQERRQA